MKRLILAAAAALGFAAMPAAALAATAGGPYGSIGQGTYEVDSIDFAGTAWNHSTVANNWYLSSQNYTTVYADAPGSNGYQHYLDYFNNNLCLTLNWPTNNVLDKTCVSGEAAQNWSDVGCGPHNCVAIHNQYMDEKKPQNCANGHVSMLRGQTATASLNFACGQSNGSSWPSQQFFWNTV